MDGSPEKILPHKTRECHEYEQGCGQGITNVGTTRAEKLVETANESESCARNAPANDECGPICSYQRSEEEAQTSKFVCLMKVASHRTQLEGWG